MVKDVRAPLECGPPAVQLRLRMQLCMTPRILKWSTGVSRQMLLIRSIVQGDRSANMMAVCIMTRVMDKAMKNTGAQPTDYVGDIQAVIEGTVEHLREVVPQAVNWIRRVLTWLGLTIASK